uniref:ALA-interacting subunit n=1 Tax=Oryza punctata TaxID=4537 RepID=A0A0E0L4X0_ORYPU
METETRQIPPHAAIAVAFDLSEERKGGKKETISPRDWIHVRIHPTNRRAGMSTSGSESDSVASKRSKKPKYSKFTQQELPAWKPLYTPGIVIGAFSLIGIVFIPIGLVSIAASQEVVELVDKYDGECVTANDKVGFIQDTKTDKACTRTITVPKPMKGPIQVYYQLENFYQNHRRYVKSRSDKQLRDQKSASVVKTCDPEGTSEGGAPIVPCGLIAWSLFNDTFTFSVNKKSIQVNKKNIAWSSDRSVKFGSDVYPKNFQKGGLIGGGQLNEKLPLSEQEDLIVWMRTAALPTFRKLYGRIETDIMASDEITVVIQNNYNTYSFGGTKALVLSTTSWIGGKNSFIGLAYVAIGSISLLVALAFVGLNVVKPRTLGDPSYLSWNKENPDYVQ